jgi:NAD(P)-dependent dehydrogenase (short-subunit alcohol dehydrogenase family)
MKIGGHNAIVTGGASGLGRATAELLAKAGAHVAIVDLNEEAGAEAAEEIGGAFSPVDMRSDESIGKALENVAETLGAPARVVVNCAGAPYPAQRLASPKGPLALDTVENVAGIHFTGTLNLMRRAAFAMMELDPLEDDERGVLINCASINAEDGPLGTLVYSAAKAGMCGMTLPAARDLGPFGIRVCCILPGNFDTPMYNLIPEDARAKLEMMIPFPKRAGDPEEFAQLVAHIVENTVLNGVNIRIDGGLRLSIA